MYIISCYFFRMTVIYSHQNQTEVITMTNERKITNEEIKALAEKYSLAAADIEKGIEGLEEEDIFLSTDYIEDMIINGDLLPLTITLNLEKATYSDTDAMYPVECDRPEELKKHICNIGYSTTVAKSHRNEAYKPSLEEIQKRQHMMEGEKQVRKPPAGKHPGQS